MKGVGDKRNGNVGGYVLRARKRLPDAEVFDVGVSGITTRRLFRDLKKNLSKSRVGYTQRAMKDADLVIIDAGRNDYWDRRSVALSARNLRRIGKLLQQLLDNGEGAKPLVAVAYQARIRRSFQQPFIDELNRHIRRLKYPKVRFNRLSPSLISAADGLHPTSRGHESLSKILAKFVSKKAQKKMSRGRQDSDGDGVYNLFEINRYQTDPMSFDSDGDGLSDGDEIFSIGTSPLQIDTDGDTKDDGIEVAAGTNPLDPAA